MNESDGASLKRFVQALARWRACLDAEAHTPPPIIQDDPRAHLDDTLELFRIASSRPRNRSNGV